MLDPETLFKQRLDQVASDTEALLDRLLLPAPLTGENTRPPRLLEAMRYSSLGGGSDFVPFWSWRRRTCSVSTASAR